MIFFFPQVKNEEKLGCGQAHFYRKMRKFGRGELELFLLLNMVIKVTLKCSISTQTGTSAKLPF